MRMVEAVSFEREPDNRRHSTAGLARMSYIVGETSLRMLEVLSFSSIERGLNFLQ